MSLSLILTHTHTHVHTLTHAQKQPSQFIQVSLREVTTASQKLKTACHDTSRQSDLAYRTRHIINSAYDVAKAARHLVTCVEKEEQLVAAGE